KTGRKKSGRAPRFQHAKCREFGSFAAASILRYHFCSSAPSYMAKIDAFFNLMFDQGASDLHLATGNPPILRIRGELQRVDFPPLENDSLKAMLYEIAPEYKIKLFEETGDVDFGYEIPNVSRFRANFFNQKNGVGAVFRQIPSK